MRWPSMSAVTTSHHCAWGDAGRLVMRTTLQPCGERSHPVPVRPPARFRSGLLLPHMQGIFRQGLPPPRGWSPSPASPSGKMARALNCTNACSNGRTWKADPSAT
jgi:hypothetical protein